MKRFYDAFGDQSFKMGYERVFRNLGEVGETYPDIEEDKAYYDPFPNMHDLMSKSKSPGASGFYKHYQFLCESHHGKLLSLYIAENEAAQYRRNLHYVYLFCIRLLKITDAHC